MPATRLEAPILHISSLQKYSSEEFTGEVPEQFPFFYATRYQRGPGYKITMILDAHIQLYKDLGFCYYKDPKDPKKEPILLHIEDNICREVDKFDILTGYMNHIKSIKGEEDENGVEKIGLISKGQLIQKALEEKDKLISPSLLSQCFRPKDNPIKFKEDEWNKSFHYFKNGYIEISKEKVYFKRYSELDGVIWDYRIHERDYNPAAEWDKSVVNQFLHNVTGNKEDEDPERYESLKTILGWSIHKYMDEEPFSPVLMDGRISNEKVAKGRSGKGLIMKLVQHFCNVIFEENVYSNVDGKGWNLKDRFRWQELEINTAIIHLNDLKQDFQLEDLYNDIDSGISAEQKNGKKQKILAKIIMSTNKSIDTRGGSSEARTYLFTLADYYTANFRPIHEFGHLFFTQWSDEQWQQFFALMAHCGQLYFEKGVTRVEGLLLAERQLIDRTTREFTKFMYDFYGGMELITDGSLDTTTNFSFNTRFDKKELLKSFIHHYEDYRHTTNNVTFVNWLRTWCLYHPDFEESVEDRDETRSGSKYFFHFRPSEKKIKAMKEAKLKKEKDDKDKAAAAAKK